MDEEQTQINYCGNCDTWYTDPESHFEYCDLLKGMIQYGQDVPKEDEW